MMKKNMTKNKNSSSILKKLYEVEASYSNKSAYDRGKADVYYGRKMFPHKIIDNQKISKVLIELGK